MSEVCYTYEKPISHSILKRALGCEVRVTNCFDTVLTGTLTRINEDCIIVKSYGPEGAEEKSMYVPCIDRFEYKKCEGIEGDTETISDSFGMNHDRFKELLEELDGNSLATLAEKNARYSSNGDALHNFRSGADIMGGTPAQACWGYLTKHLTALRDMVQRDDFSNREDFLEKCQDTINYIRFLWCIGNDTEEQSKTVNELIKEKEM